MQNCFESQSIGMNVGISIPSMITVTVRQTALEEKWMKNSTHLLREVFLDRWELSWIQQKGSGFGEHLLVQARYSSCFRSQSHKRKRWQIKHVWVNHQGKAMDGTQREGKWHSWDPVSSLFNWRVVLFNEMRNIRRKLGTNGWLQPHFSTSWLWDIWMVKSGKGNTWDFCTKMWCIETEEDIGPD